MEFKQVEHYDCFADETIYWIDISNPPQEIQNQAREIDGEEYNPDGFGICMCYELATHEFAAVTDTEYPTGENCNIFYIDNDGYKHWFKIDLAEELLKEIYDACDKITAGKMTENGYTVTDCVRFGDGRGFALAEKVDAEHPFKVIKVSVDECGRWRYGAQRTFESAEAARSNYSMRIKSYEQFHSIGIEYHAEHDGAFTGDGYTFRRSSAEREQTVAFRVYLRKSGMRSLDRDPFVLTLPATDADIHCAKSTLNIGDFKDAAIVKIESPEMLLLESVLRGKLDITLLNEIAGAYAEAMKGPDAGKLRPALAMEEPTTLEGTLDVLNSLENYEVISCSAEEYGRGALQELCGDQEIVDTVDGFIDWKAFGNHMMDSEGITQTEYGLIRRVSDPAPEQGMDVQPMQSPFL